MQRKQGFDSYQEKDENRIWFQPMPSVCFSVVRNHKALHLTKRMYVACLLATLCNPASVAFAPANV